MAGNLGSTEVVLNVSDFVAIANQTFEYALTNVTIRGELANFRVSKGKWVYFDLKDDTALVRFFGTIFMLPGPLEDGMLLRVRGTPRLHPQYGFSVTVSSIQPEGLGDIRRAADLLHAKLAAEGLFDESRKRALPYPPVRIGLIASTESAAYADFLKVLTARWGGVAIECVDIQVQGEAAPAQIVAALEYFNQQAQLPDVLVVTRGGGSAEDLYAFSTEQVTRAVAASRIPTLIAIGHEVDLSLAELAADQRASTPSNAAELLVPNRHEARQTLMQLSARLQLVTLNLIRAQSQHVAHIASAMYQSISMLVIREQNKLEAARRLLTALDPHSVLQRGFAIVRYRDRAIQSRKLVKHDDVVSIELQDGSFNASVE